MFGFGSMFRHMIIGGSASIEMRIYYSTSQSIKRGWQGAKNMLVKSGASGMRNFPRATPYFKTSIANFFFRRAPRKLEAAETLVFFFGPAKMQDLGACVCQILYPFGHREVIGSKFLQSFIRGAKFIDRVPPEFEEYGRSERPLLTFDDHNKSITGTNYMPLNVNEKRLRLRRDSMPAARPNM